MNPRRSPAILAFLIACGLLSALGGCAPTRGEVVAANVEAFRQEQTSDKLLARGLAFAQLGDYTRAEQYLAAAIEAGADEPKVMPHLLRVCAQDHRYRVAIQYAENYLRSHPDDASARFLLASMDYAVSDRVGAITELHSVLLQQPKHAEAHFVLASIERDGGDPVEADKHFREYLQLAPTGMHVAEARSSLLKSVP